MAGNVRIKIISLIFSCLFYHFNYVEASECIKEPPCLCKCNNDVKLDLSGVVINNTFLVAQQENLIIYFHPCKDAKFNVSEHKLVVNETRNGCKTPTGLCLYDSGKQTTTSLGNEKSSKFITSNPRISPDLIYFESDKNITTEITLVCIDLTYNFSFLKLEKPLLSNQYHLYLFSPHACQINDHKGISTGSLLIILFATFFGTYLIGGALVLHFLRGARGTEMIPNIDFWSRLPGLIRDGLVFLLRGGSTSSLSTAETYDRI